MLSLEENLFFFADKICLDGRVYRGTACVNDADFSGIFFIMSA
jgi:hypothetical protein